MRMRLSIVAVVAVILAIGGVTLASASSDEGSSDDHSQVIKLFAVTVQQADIDLGATGESLGDRFVFADDVYREKGGEKVGHDGGECTVVRLDAEARTATVQCVVSLSLDDKGQITVQGLATFSETQTSAPPLTFPVTGGSGDFKGVDGEVTVEEISATEANLTLHLD
jgi:hypothetical protein